MRGKNYENKTFPNRNLPLHSGVHPRRLRPALRCVVFHSLPALAAGDVSGAIESTWNEAKTQIQNVVNHVVFPVIDMILAILFFVKVATCYFEYRKHGQLELAAPCILFACLIFTLTAPLYLWSIL